MSAIHERQRVLVAGGAGFLGAHLCRKLLADGHEVVCLDSFITGSPERLEPFSAHPQFQVIEQDILEPLPEGLAPTHIYNLACPASPPHYQRDPIHTLRTCVVGTDRLLDYAVRHEAAFLMASTSEVYGDPTEHPQNEQYRGNVNPQSVRACYDEGKRCAETLCADYRRLFPINVKIARIFNTYGPGMASDDGRLVSNFIWQAIHGSPLTIYGSGEQTRSLCYVDDLIDGLTRLMDATVPAGGPVNLGNPSERTVIDIARQIHRLTGSTSNFEFLPAAVDDPQQRCPDITLAKTYLDWTPTTGLEEGLAYTRDYFLEAAARLHSRTPM